ncbi:MAG: TetR/AcrR family transcriptional regulator [Marmoricola sp.]
MGDGVKEPRGAVDRRSARWDEHREARRAELVAAAVAAIDAHGPGASISEMASAAGVSKPVLYRYFADKDDLYRAVGQWGAHEVLGALLPVLRSDDDVRTKIDEGCREYLRIIDAHPQVFFLLVEHRTADDPLADGKEVIAATFARAMVEVFRRLGIDAAGAEPWAHGVEGLGLSQGEWWLRRRPMTRHDAAAYLAAFIWHAFDGIARDHGVDLGAPRPLRRVDGTAT